MPGRIIISRLFSPSNSRYHVSQNSDLAAHPSPPPRINAPSLGFFLERRDTPTRNIMIGGHSVSVSSVESERAQPLVPRSRPALGQTRPFTPIRTEKLRRGAGMCTNDDACDRAEFPGSDNVSLGVS